MPNWYQSKVNPVATVTQVPDDEDRLGRGVSFRPFVKAKRLFIEGGKAHVRDCMIDRLECPLGTRFYLPNYGSKLYLLKFDPTDSTSLYKAKLYTEECLANEPRISVADVTTEFVKDPATNRYGCRIVVKYVFNDTGLVDSVQIDYYSRYELDD